MYEIERETDAVQRDNKSSVEMSVVIPTHNKAEDVERCVSGVLSMPFNYGRFEVVVVDDGSREPIEERLRKFDRGDVALRVVRLEGSGPAAARNAGIREAKGDIVAFCDDDAIPQDGYLDAIYEPFTTSSEVVGVEGAVIPIDGEEFGLLGMSPKNDCGGVYLTCNIAFRRDILVRVGGLDQAFPFPAFEDCDLAAACEEHGTIIWQPAAIVHHPRRCWSLWRAVREIKFYEPLVLFARRYGYLGWPDRPTKYPAIRVYWSAVVALPAGRILSGLKALVGSRKTTTLRFIGISLAQAVVASVASLGPIRKGLKADVTRRNWLTQDGISSVN